MKIMKKVSLFFVLFGILVVSFAQIKNKHGELILPETGNYALGVNAVPFLNYFGNIFNNSASVTTNWEYVNKDTHIIYGKYMIDDKSAYRVGLRLGFLNSALSNHVVPKNGDPAKYVDDKISQTDMNVMFLLGKEYRRGKGRVQGKYGAEATIVLSTSKASFTYGNDYATAYPNPTSTTWTVARAQTPAFNSMTTSSSRILSQNFGTSFGLGARAFVGVEYFILPKFSIGGEFGYGLGILSLGKTSIETEAWTGTETKVTKVDLVGGRQIVLDNDNMDGAIMLLFYF